MDRPSQQHDVDESEPPRDGAVELAHAANSGDDSLELTSTHRSCTPRRELGPDLVGDPRVLRIGLCRAEQHALREVLLGLIRIMRTAAQLECHRLRVISALANLSLEQLLTTEPR